MRFDTAEQVLAWAKETAAKDVERNSILHPPNEWNPTPWQWDLNPYSTAGARNDWQRGFDNAPPYSWEEPTRAFDLQFQLGRAAAEFLKEREASNATEA